MKEKIKELLRETGRENIENLIDYMEAAGFFEAPASTSFHGAEDGSLAKHSMAVNKYAHIIAESLLQPEEYNKYYNSITICALLHDLGKAGQFGKKLYLPNILKSGKQSESKPYEKNKELLPVEHEVVSVIEATRYINLTEEEQLAILWHNGLYGDFKYHIQGKETKLYMIIHWADMWASRTEI